MLETGDTAGRLSACSQRAFTTSQGRVTVASEGGRDTSEREQEEHLSLAGLCLSLLTTTSHPSAHNRPPPYLHVSYFYF